MSDNIHTKLDRHLEVLTGVIRSGDMQSIYAAAAHLRDFALANGAKGPEENVPVTDEARSWYATNTHLHDFMQAVCFRWRKNQAEDAIERAQR